MYQYNSFSEQCESNFHQSNPLKINSNLISSTHPPVHCPQCPPTHQTSASSPAKSPNLKAHQNTSSPPPTHQATHISPPIHRPAEPTPVHQISPLYFHRPFFKTIIFRSCNFSTVPLRSAKSKGLLLELFGICSVTLMNFNFNT